MIDLRLKPSFAGPLRLWKYPDPERYYAIGVDTAGGKTRADWSVATVCEARTREDVAQWRGHVEPSGLADEIMKLAEFYKGKSGQAFVIVEINNHGLATLDALRALGAYNLYRRLEWDRVKSCFQEAIGWNTSQKTKPILIARGRAALADPSVKINSTTTMQEALTFIRDELDRASHEDGANDDALISWLLALEGCHQLSANEGLEPETTETEPALMTHRERLVQIQAPFWDAHKRHMQEIAARQSTSWEDIEDELHIRGVQTPPGRPGGVLYFED